MDKIREQIRWLREGVNGGHAQTIADTMEAMLEVVEAADLCKRVGYYAQDLNTGRFAGDILMDALDKLKALQTNDD